MMLHSYEVREETIRIKEVLQTLLILAILLTASAFFSGSETAMFSLPRTRVEALRREKGRKGETLARLLRKPSNLLVTILIGNMTVNILSSSVSAGFATKLLGSEGLAFSIVIMWFAILIVGEITPKIIAIRQNESLALAASPVINAFALPSSFKISEILANPLHRFLIYKNFQGFFPTLPLIITHDHCSGLTVFGNHIHQSVI